MQSKRDLIIKELNAHLGAINANIEIFNIYVFDKDNLPLIIIKDTDDEVQAASFETISHDLSVELNLITASYNANNELLRSVLNALKEFKGKFQKMELLSVNRSDIEVLDLNYVLCKIALKFSYQTPLWEV